VIGTPRRVLVVTSGALFVRGGHLVIAEQICAALRRAGHDAELLVTPQNRFGRQLSAYLATWLSDVGETADGKPIDQVISLRFPSYAVRHPHHVCWLNHRMREYYDLWGRFVRGLGRRGRLKERVRRGLFRALDRWLLRHNVTHLFAQSRTVQERLLQMGGIASEVLYPPAPERPYRNDGYGDYVLGVSRLHPLKRLDLLVEAAAQMRWSSLRFKIAGEGEERERLRCRIDELGLAGRIELLGGVSESELVELYAGCRAVFFAPWSEDYGFVTLEAFRSQKPVITTNDSGGPAELVRQGHNGLVGSAAPEELAVHLDALEDETLVSRLGKAAAETARAHTWEAALARLLGR
jgi:glycosyltransferase involved in cell wall biosynthesis